MIRTLAIAFCLVLGCKRPEVPSVPSVPSPPAAEPQAAPMPTPEPAKVEPPKAAATPSAPKLKAAHLAGLKALPDGTLAALSVDVGWLLSQAVDHDFGLIEPTGDVSALRKSLSEASVKELGIDVLKAKVCVAWAAPQKKAVAAWFDGPFDGALKVGEKASIAGKDVMALGDHVFATIDGGRLIIGNEAGVELSLVPPTEKMAKDAIKLHIRALDAAGDGVLVMSANAGPLASALPPPFDKLQSGALVAGGDGYGAAVVGDKVALDTIVASFNSARTQALNLVDQKLAEVRRDDHSQGLLFLLTFARAKLEDVAAAAKLAQDGDILSTHVAGGTSTWVLGMTATMGAVAVPAFVRYIRRAKTAEALENLDLLYRASEFYFAAPRVDASGNRLPCQLPPSQKMTPDVSNKACCPGGPGDKDGDGRCDPNPAQWETPTWKTLNFALSNPHFFGYSYESSGTGKTAKFTVSAYADLDCDGVLSTFQRTGTANDATPEGECALKPAAAMTSGHEDE